MQYFSRGFQNSLILHFNRFTFLSVWNSCIAGSERKKRYEKQLAQIDGTLSTIEFQREALENAHHQHRGHQ